MARTRADADPTPEPAARPLTPTEADFVAHWCVHRCSVRAYKAVHPGATTASARRLGSAMRRAPAVAAAIRAEKRAQARRLRLDADAVLREIARCAFSDVIDLFDQEGLRFRSPRDIPLAARRAVQSYKFSRTTTRTTTTRSGKTRTTVTVSDQVISVRFVDKLAALGLLAKHLGLAAEIAPLEALLRALPEDVASEVRGALPGGLMRE